MHIPNELHDIVIERVMISHGAAFLRFCEFGDSLVYLKTKAHHLYISLNLSVNQVAGIIKVFLITSGENTQHLG
jgi:cation transport regulator ChaC